MRLDRRHPLPWLAFIASAVLALGLGVTASATVAAVDGAVVRSVHLNAVQPAISSWILAVTDLGATEVVLSVTAIAAALLVALRHWHGALVLVLSVAATQAIVSFVKDLVARPRPADHYAVADAGGFSFPSGHSATSVALYATVALIAARAVSGSLRVAVAVVGGGVVIAVGASRVYLGAHYPTDVLAGWLTGAAVVLISWALVARLRAARPWARLASG